MTFWRRTTSALVASAALLALVGCGDRDVQAESSGELQVDPSPISFGQVETGSSSTQRIELSNVGEGPLDIKNIRIEEEDAGEVAEIKPGGKWPGQFPVTIPAEDDAVHGIELQYAPVDSDQDAAELVFETNGVEPEVRIDVETQPLQPRLDAPDRISFSSVPPDSRAFKNKTVTNIGSAPLKINEISISGNDEFQVTKPTGDTSGSDNEDKENNGNGEGEGEGDGPKPGDDDPPSEFSGTELGPTESMTFRVWFSPNDNSPESADLLIDTNDPNSGNKTVPVIGNSGSPCLGLNHENEIKFGSTSTEREATRTVTVENCRPRSSDLEISDVRIKESDGGVFTLREDTLPGNLPDETFVIKGGDRSNFVVGFAPDAKEDYSGTLVIESNDPSRREHEIQLTGSGSDNKCPTAEAVGSTPDSDRQRKQISDALPLDTIQLDGTNSSDPDGDISRYEWSIIDRPSDSTATLTPSSTAKKPNLYLDLAGEYKVELVVYDNDGAASCGERAVVSISAIPQEDIHVQLVWDTPADPDETDSNGTDLDLHYKNPKGDAWNEAPWDIFWHNKTADWGQPNIAEDDPSLDIDDTDGAGPENINHDNPASSSTGYQVGVYYYDDHGFGPSYATVRIYLNGSLAKEYKNKFMSGTFDFWYVGNIQWPNQNIFKRDEKFTGFPNQ